MRFQFSLARLLLAVAAFAATLGSLRPLGDESLPAAIIASCAMAGVVLIADVTAGLPALLTRLLGWITYGLVCGAGIGFAMNDLRAAMRGSSWNGPYAPDDVLACMVVGLFVGTIGGVVLDVVSHEYKWSWRRLWWAWSGLPLLIVFVYPIVRGFFDHARE
jgi:hypothetical protein